MDHLVSLFWGLIGGILGAFFKFWIQDFRDAQRTRLTVRDKIALFEMLKESGHAKVRHIRGRSPFFQSSVHDIDHPENDAFFEDRGEIHRLIELGYIEEFSRDVDGKSINYRFTGKGWKRAEDLDPGDFGVGIRAQ